MLGGTYHKNQTHRPHEAHNEHVLRGQPAVVRGSVPVGVDGGGHGDYDGGREVGAVQVPAAAGVLRLEHFD